MLGKLKAMAGEGAMKKAVDAVSPALNEHLEVVRELDPAQVRDDETFRARVIQPALLAVTAASSGLTSLVPRFEERFARALFHLRNELVVVEDGSVRLADDFQGRLPGVLMEGLRQEA